MKNLNLINWSLVAESSPKQTNDTQSRQNRVGGIPYLFRTLILLITLLTLGVGQMWADGQYNQNWRGNVFFLAPDNWNLSTNSHVQIAITRSSSASTSTRSDFTGDMTRVGSTRLYYIWLDINHSDWGQNEWIAFTANSSSWGTAGNITLSNCACYTKPYDYGVGNDECPYLFTPGSAGNNATMTGTCYTSGSSYDDRWYPLLDKDQKVYLYTNGNSSATGGTVTIAGTYMSAKNTTTSTGSATSSSTDVTYTTLIGSTVTLTATANTGSGYYFVGWYTAASGGDLISTDNPHTYTCKGAKDIYARFEKRYSVTVNAGSNGTTTPSSGSTITAGYYTTGTASATANNGYYFTGWTLPTGTSAASGYSITSSPIELHATAASMTITANFAPKWRIIGGNSGSADGSDAMGDWSETANQITSNLTANSGSTSITLNANTTYHFKVLDKSTSTYYSYNGGVQQMVYPTDDGKEWTLYTGNANSQIVTAGAGSYTFAWNNSTHKLMVDFPTSYTITYGYGTGGASVAATGSVSGSVATTKYVAGGENVTFTQSAATGYTFKEWNTQADGLGTRLGTSSSLTISSISENKTVYAIYTPNVYTLTFHLNGGDSYSNYGNATNSAGTVTLNVEYDQVLNSLTLPYAVKNAYHFRSWSTSNEYFSSCVWKYDYNVGTQTSSLGWTELTNYVTQDGDNYIWKKAANVDLYAHYFTPFEPTLSFTPQHVVPEGEVAATLRFSPVAGAPEGSYIVCYMLTTAAGTILQAQPEWKNKDDATFTVSFDVPASPGEYSLGLKVFPGTSATWYSPGHSVYFDGNCTGIYSTYKFEVEDMNAVTVSYKCGDADMQPSTTVYATWNNPAKLTAPDFPGMQFVNWTFTGSASLKPGYEATNKTIEVRATGTGTATANYSQGRLFFKDTKGWVVNPETDSVYIYFYSANKWTTSSGNSEGTGSNGAGFHSGPFGMSLLDGTDDVYYFDEEKHGTMPAFAAVAFSKEKMKDYNYFAGTTATTDPCHVVYVNAFDANKPMIVPLGGGALWNKNYARYYAHDLAPLLADWGYDLRGDNDIIGWSPATDADKHKFKAPKMGDLSFSTTIYIGNVYSAKEWKIYNGNKGYGRSDNQKLTASSPTSGVLTNHDASGYNLNIQSNTPGEYTYTLTFGTECTDDDGATTYGGPAAANGLMKHMTVTITYPVIVGDFRLFYDDKDHPGNVIKKRANGVDVVDLYVEANHANDIKVQTCTAVSNSSVTWGSLATPTYSGVDFSAILAEGGSGVYSFTVTQNEEGTSYAITNVEKYKGRFYVRTNCVNDDKWNYKDSKDAHAMTYSDYSTTLEDADMRYSHYYVDDLHGTNESKINIRFTVATDYSEAICDTVFDGDASGKWKDYFHTENLAQTANVRFTYDQARNKVWRAYTEGPENDNYMVLRSNGRDVFEANSDGTNSETASAAIKFDDLNNWVYQVDAYANVGSYIKLTAGINSQTQYIKGESGVGDDENEFTEDDGVLLVGGSSATAQHMRITYDFKTDRMMTSWLPAGSVSGTLDINADIMLIRKEQDGAASVTFTEGSKLTDVKTAYGVMQFTKDYINDYSYSRYARNLYWISFPFDVNLSDVFGFGKYGQHWIIEYYDGKGRAEKGFWAESAPNWKYVTEEIKDEFVLKANEGYILALALSNMGTGSDIWANNVTSVYLYFPSAKEIGSLAEIDEVTVKLDTVGYKCNITRDNRNIKDSYWRCIGAPSFAQSTRTGLPTTEPANWETKVPYLYTWNNINNSLAITSSSTVNFLAMHSYLVQYPDDVIVWTNVTNKPASIVARRRAEGREAAFREWNLNLLNDNKHMDHTYVRLSEDENVTENFDFGNDLSKEFNSGSNIYTFVDGVEVAGNVRPFSESTTTIPVGVKIADNGDYTFSMPEGTEGTGVTLVDNTTGERTNLGLNSYTVTLQQGTYNERFSLEIPAIQNTTVDIEAVSDQQADIRKVMVDGVLYIVKDGKIFDARGNLVK